MKKLKLDNKSHYDVMKWNKERERTVTYLKNICEFKPIGTVSNLRSSCQSSFVLFIGKK
jgi:hypothetical protein